MNSSVKKTWHMEVTMRKKFYDRTQVGDLYYFEAPEAIAQLET